MKEWRDVVYALAIAAALGALLTKAHGQRLVWDASPEPDIAGYRLYYGPTNGVYTNLVATVTNRMTTNYWGITNLPKWRIFTFAATAYDSNGLESDFSNSAQWTNRGNKPFNFRVVP
jgi:hypothetical protein